MTPAFGEAQAAGMAAGRPTGSAASASEALRFAQTMARTCAEALGQAVAQDPLTDAQLAALTEALAGHRPRAPRPVDLRVVTGQVAASPTPAPPMAVELSVCRAHGRSLLGAAPAELIG
jgi:hypothetical protein